MKRFVSSGRHRQTRRDWASTRPCALGGSLSKEEGEFLVLFTVDHLLARTSGFERVPMEDRLARLGEIGNAARERRSSGEAAAAED